jgi:hypothetical protein
LRRHLRFPVPPTVMQAFQSLPVSPIMRLEYRTRTRPPSLMKGILEICFLYNHYARHRQPVGLFWKLKGFPEFLQHLFGLERLCQLPLYVVLDFARRFRETAVSIWNWLPKWLSRYEGKESG